MRKIYYLIFLCSLFCSEEIFAQKLVLTRNGFRSSDNVISNEIVYSYKSGVNKKEFRNHCIKCLSQPEFFIYKIDYADDNVFKLRGYINTKPEKHMLIKHQIEMCLNILMEEQSVIISSDLFDNKGKKLDYDRLFNKKGVIKNEKFKSNIEDQIDKLIHSVMELKVIIH